MSECVCWQEKWKLRRKKKFPGHVYMFLVCVILRKLLDDRFRDLQFYHKEQLLWSTNMYSINRIMEMIIFFLLLMKPWKNRHFYCNLILIIVFLWCQRQNQILLSFMQCVFINIVRSHNYFPSTIIYFKCKIGIIEWAWN